MKRSLFFKNRARVRGGLGKQTSTKFEKAFGSVVPSSIPESTAWWRRQSKELAAITDDVESGLMNLMVTITHNNLSPEFLACVRRGPFAKPRPLEMIEYLLGRTRKSERRPAFEKYPCEHAPVPAVPPR